MPKANHQNVCQLCHQKVEIEGFSLVLAGHTYHFCCTGCLSIFKLLDETSLADILPPQPNKEIPK